MKSTGAGVWGYSGAPVGIGRREAGELCAVWGSSMDGTGKTQHNTLFVPFCGAVSSARRPGRSKLRGRRIGGGGSRVNLHTRLGFKLSAPTVLH